MNCRSVLLTFSLFTSACVHAQPASTEPVLGQSKGSGQAYPAKPIRIVVGFAPGGPTDIYARLIGQKFTAAWGQPVIVDARPGASGNIGADLVAKSPPDGYTLLLPSFSIAVNPSLYTKLPYDLMRDFAPVSLYASVGHILVIHPSVPARNVQELLALVKKQPASQPDLCLCGQWHSVAPRRRTLQHDGGCEAHAHSIQRHGAGANRRHRRPSVDVVRQSFDRAQCHTLEAPAADGRDHPGTTVKRARCTHAV